MRLRGAAVVITGASSGIGAAAAIRFARAGARLALCARRLDRLQQVADRCRSAGAADVVLRRADIGRAGDARAFINVALQQFDRIDVLVNNAGRGWHGRLQDMPEDEVADLLNTNLFGCIWTIQSALPTMLESGSGVIVNVASVVGFRAVPYSAVYSASKHALTGLGHALRGELSGSGVKICTVYPGTTETEFFGDGKPEGPLVQSADSVAKSIVRNARRPRRDVIMVPYRVGQFAEPLLGGVLDHALGETRRNSHPEYRA